MSPICCKPFSRGVKSAHQSVEGARRCELKGCKDFCQRRLGEAKIAEKSDPERANRAQDSSQTDWRRGVGKDNSSFRLYSELVIEVKDVVYASVKSYSVGAGKRICDLVVKSREGFSRAKRPELRVPEVRQLSKLALPVGP